QRCKRIGSRKRSNFLLVNSRRKWPQRIQSYARLSVRFIEVQNVSICDWESRRIFYSIFGKRRIVSLFPREEGFRLKRRWRRFFGFTSNVKILRKGLAESSRKRDSAGWGVGRQESETRSRKQSRRL